MFVGVSLAAADVCHGSRGVTVCHYGTIVYPVTCVKTSLLTTLLYIVGMTIQFQQFSHDFVQKHEILRIHGEKVKLCRSF